jgi:hypothetical protein
VARADAALSQARPEAFEIPKQRGVIQEFSWRFKLLRRKDPRLDYGRAYAC